MKTTSKLIFSIATILSLNVFAHGEDKPGPHGGFIRMPGAFHTEVLQTKEGFRIYLLDINWKNPSVLDSSVTATIKTGKKKTELVCSQEEDSFLCKTATFKKGVLTIMAKREGQMGIDANYKLPLKLEAEKNEHIDHSGH